MAAQTVTFLAAAAAVKLPWGKTAGLLLTELGVTAGRASRPVSTERRQLLLVVAAVVALLVEVQVLMVAAMAATTRMAVLEPQTQAVGAVGVKTLHNLAAQAVRASSSFATPSASHNFLGVNTWLILHKSTTTASSLKSSS